MHQLLPQRKSDSHKYDYGHVMVVGGSQGMSGAPVLVSSAALRAGAGLVSAAVPADIQQTVASYLPEIMTLGLSCENGAVTSSCLTVIDDYIAQRKVNVVAFGCGMSSADDVGFILRKLLKYQDCPLVIDADGLNVLAHDLSCLQGHKYPVVLTPHRGEFARLTGLKKEALNIDLKAAVADFARKYNVCVLLKGPNTIVAEGKDIYVNRTGNPGMATAGSGDVLTGIIAGLLAQGSGTFAAASSGAYLHGAAADKAVLDLTEYSMVASDIIKYLPGAIKDLCCKKNV